MVDESRNTFFNFGTHPYLSNYDAKHLVFFCVISTISSAKNESFVTKKGCDLFLILVPMSKFSTGAARDFFFFFVR